MSKTKYCSGCKQTLPLHMFTINRSRKDGLQSQCKICRRKYSRQYYNQNKAYYVERARQQKAVMREWLIEYKQKLSCQHCGYNKHHSALDFHHKDKNKKELNLSQVGNFGWGKQRILKEINKCIILCANCHRILHNVPEESVFHLVS